MKTIKSKSDKRIIVDVTMNGKEVPMLIDTGATVGLVSNKLKGLVFDNRPLLPLQGFGSMGTAKGRRVVTQGIIGDKNISQFLATDIRNIQSSIKAETGITIEGVIGLPQMKFVGMIVDTSANVIKIP